jgi:hypothetical protein
MAHLHSAAAHKTVAAGSPNRVLGRSCSAFLREASSSASRAVVEEISSASAQGRVWGLWLTRALTLRSSNASMSAGSYTLLITVSRSPPWP